MSLNQALEAGAVRLLACARQWGVDPGDVLDRFVAHFTDHPPSGRVDDQAGNLHRFGLKSLHCLCDRMETSADAGRVRWTLKEVFNDLNAGKDASATFLYALCQRLPHSGLNVEERSVLDHARAHFIHAQIRMKADSVMAQRPDWASEEARGLAERRLSALLGVSPSSSRHDAAEAAAAHHLFPPTAENLDNLLTGMRDFAAQQLFLLKKGRLAQPGLPGWPERVAHIGRELAAASGSRAPQAMHSSRAPQFMYSSRTPLSEPVQATDDRSARTGLRLATAHASGGRLSVPIQVTDMPQAPTARRIARTYSSEFGGFPE